MTCKIFAVYSKGFQNTFSALEISKFFILEIRKVMTPWGVQLKFQNIRLVHKYARHAQFKYRYCL